VSQDRQIDVDVVVVGSGFGGSVTALRLTEKGYRVAVLETGRRFDESTYPKTSWRARSFFWAPKLGCYGMQRISFLKDVMPCRARESGRLAHLREHSTSRLRRSSTTPMVGDH